MAIVMISAQDDRMIATLAQPAFWSMKIKIAILALATFIAMC
jgi:hypothetical protein